MPTGPVQPPIWSPPLSGRDAALVAGYILHYRQGVLNALDFLDLADLSPIPDWGSGEREFFQAGEQWTRYLLWWTGYRVAKGEMWPQEPMRDRP